MVNNAVVRYAAPVEEFAVGEWDLSVAVNLSAAFHTIRLALPAMRKRDWGRIVNVSSIAGLIGSAGPLAYTASKGAVRLLSKSVALYCAEKKYDIRCNSVHPGGVDTPIFNPVWQAIGRDQGKALIESRHPIGRMAAPAELGEMLLALFELAVRGRNDDQRPLH